MTETSKSVKDIAVSARDTSWNMSEKSSDIGVRESSSCRVVAVSSRAADVVVGGWAVGSWVETVERP